MAYDPKKEELFDRMRVLIHSLEKEKACVWAGFALLGRDHPIAAQLMLGIGDVLEACDVELDEWGKTHGKLVDPDFDAKYMTKLVEKLEKEKHEQRNADRHDASGSGSDVIDV